MSVLIGGKEYIMLREAARKAGVTYMGLYMWLTRHPDFPRERLGKLILVRMEDVQQQYIGIRA